MSSALQQLFASLTAGIGNAGNDLLARVQLVGLTGQFVVGLVVGLVWRPCVGPTLGAAIVLASQGTNLAQAGSMMAVFGIGAALPLVALAYVSRSAIGRTRSKLLHAGKAGKVLLGAIMLALAALILTGADKPMEAWLVEHSPAWLTQLTTSIARRCGEGLSRYLSRPHHVHSVAPPTDPDLLMACLQPGDVLLVEGQSRVSVAIKYLPQSPWSHAALFVGTAGRPTDAEGRPRCFLEADLREGVRLVSVAEFADLHTRVCRPVGLTAAEIDTLVGTAVARLGHQYDLKNVIDLARYLLPTPPVPVRWRRRMLGLGSGAPDLKCPLQGVRMSAHGPCIVIGQRPLDAFQFAADIGQMDVVQHCQRRAGCNAGDGRQLQRLQQVRNLQGFGQNGVESGLARARQVPAPGTG
ncbi:hypothetical protein G6F40_012832 [Rhizopus arrhizus]|nr:hypothetical protein G6F40_012832 [Rhizopus arrhizus]